MSSKLPVGTPPHFQIRQAVQTALAEDIGFADLTSSTLLSNTMSAKAQIVAKEPMVVAGLAVAQEVFHQIDNLLILKFHQHDGDKVKAKARLLTIKGNAQALLQAERVALNFLQRLSGISTLTQKFCQAVRTYPVKIADTRKTTPGLRALEKWAVRLGGGSNHRFSLNDGILIKDNHLLILASYNISLKEACLIARQKAPHGLRISVEVETIDQVRQALQGKADIILLDNMSPAKIRQSIHIIQSKALIEISGGITLDNIQEMATTGVDIISIGALTHSAPAMDLSLDITPMRQARISRKA